MALSMMKDEERLDVLKEIGGSKVYEDRRKESLKVIQDADGRTQQIAELVGSGKTCIRDIASSCTQTVDICPELRKPVNYFSLHQDKADIA